MFPNSRWYRPMQIEKDCTCERDIWQVNSIQENIKPFNIVLTKTSKV